MTGHQEIPRCGSDTKLPVALRRFTMVLNLSGITSDESWNTTDNRSSIVVDGGTEIDNKGDEKTMEGRI